MKTHRKTSFMLGPLNSIVIGEENRTYVNIQFVHPHIQDIPKISYIVVIILILTAQDICTEPYIWETDSLLTI